VKWGILVGLLGLAAALPQAAAASGWERAFRLAGPETLDITAPRLAIAASGTVAVAYSRYDQDSPAKSQAYLVLRSPQGRVTGPRAVAGAQEVLDLSYSRSTLGVLFGGSERGKVCCSYARVGSVSGGGLGRTQTVVDGLAGFSLGRLIALGSGRLLAAVATERGVWAAQSDSQGRFGPTRHLSDKRRSPWSLAATVLPSASTFIGWTQAAQQPGGPGPRSLTVAQGSASAGPRSGRTAFSVPAGHQLEEVALAPGRGTATAGWVESWFGSDRSYHSQAVVTDLAGRARGRAFPINGTVASGVTAAGDGSGENVVAWKACDRAAVCAVWAVFRRSGGRLSSPARLGSIDASQVPVAAIGARGRAVVGWVAGGHVLAAARGPSSHGFSAPQTVRTSSFAHDLTMAIAADGSIVAAWTEGTLHPSVVGAFFRP
jgi:hypothetical protein